MKRFLIIILLLVISLNMVSCSKTPTDPEGSKDDKTTEKNDDGVILDEEIWE